MAAIVVTIAQQKGGAGKTTLAANLAVTFAAGGRRVTLVDIDPQGSLSGWFDLRRANPQAAAVPLGFAGVSGWRVAGAVEKIARDCDLVIVDSPPHAETEARVAIRAAQLVLVPVQPSPMDLWATAPTLDLAAKEKVAAALVLNRVPPRGKVVDAVRAKIKADRLPLLRAALGNRTLFAAAMMEGLGVTECAPASVAAREIAALAKELTNKIKKI